MPKCFNTTWTPELLIHTLKSVKVLSGSFHTMQIFNIAALQIDKKYQ